MHYFSLDTTGVESFFSDLIDYQSPQLQTALDQLKNKSGLGGEFTGWMDLPYPTTADLQVLQETAEYFKNECKYVVCIGIGGSYLGTKAIISALETPWACNEGKTEILFAGNNLDEDYIAGLLHFLSNKPFGIINISKSGTTTEPAIAFRLLKALLIKQVGTERARHLIVAITDETKGILRTMVNTEGYASFVIPSNVGGRFSVLSPVGLLPIAIAGYDIKSLLAGARNMAEKVSPRISPKLNEAARYAWLRYLLYKQGRKIEILGNYTSSLSDLEEWWKQLFGESEGKERRGIFPATVNFTSDLHSLGQWIQESERTIFETILLVSNPREEVRIPYEESNLDGLNFLAEKRISQINRLASLGTFIAHQDGGVPVFRITIDSISEYTIGGLIYFFEMAVAIGGYLLGVNPFDQPGVEAYKNNMFALMDKPGYEKQTLELKMQLKKKNLESL